MKEKIKAAFNKAYLTYDAHSQLQAETNAVLIQLLKPYAFSSDIIADLGCGTGNSTQQLVENFSYKKLYAIDFAEQLLTLAQEKLNSKKIKFCLKDFDALNFPPNTFDLVFSNMALQWSQCLQTILATLFAQLNLAGIVCFSFPIQGTFAEINESHRNSFYRLDEIIAMLQKANFTLLRTEQKTYPLHFSSELDLLKSIQKVGANCCVKPTPISTLRGRRVFKDILNTDAKLTLTYNIGFFIVQKIS